MPSDKIGHIRHKGRDAEGLDVWGVEVQVGTGADRRSVSGTVHGTKREAQLLAAQLRTSLLGAPAGIVDMTLDEFFYSIFLPKRCSGLGAATVKGYVNGFKKDISPRDGSKLLAQIDELTVAATIKSCRAQKNARKIYSCIMSSAREEKLIPRKLDFGEVRISAGGKKKMPFRWSPAEVLQAAERLRDEEPIELYLILGCSGLRMEECLGVRPKSFLWVKKGERNAALAVKIDAAYTDLDGLKGTKNEESERIAPIVPIYRDMALELIESMKPTIQAAGPDAYVISYVTGWRKRRVDHYREELFEGSYRDAARRARSIEESTTLPGGSLRVKVEPFGDGGDSWVLRVPVSCSYGTARDYEKEPFSGTYAEAKRHALERWMDMRLIPCREGYLRSRWKRALEQRGLRMVWPSSLRKSSENLMVSSKVPEAAVQKLHGHSTFSTDYSYYYDVDLAGMVEATEAIREYLSNQDPEETYATALVDFS